MEQSHLENLQEYAACKNLPEFTPSVRQNVLASNPLSPEVYLTYFNDLYEHSKDQYFGLHYGGFLSLQSLYVVFDISLTVSSIRQLATIWKNYALSSFPLLIIEESEKTDNYSLIFKNTIELGITPQIMDALLIFSYRELKIITDVDAIHITLPYLILTEYKLWFDCPIKTGTSYSISFNKPADQIVTNKNKRKRIELLLPAFLHHLDRLKSEQPNFARQVRMMILNLCNPSFPTIEKVATQFCITVRTLQRRLKEENTSFRGINNNLKKEIYLYISKGKELKTIETSYILGYSSSSAFLHALKSWQLP